MYRMVVKGVKEGVCITSPHGRYHIIRDKLILGI